jgi:hypothetical protein
VSDDEHSYVQRTGRPRRGPQDGNDRVARIARWLKQTDQPAGAVELTLECGTNDEREMVSRWRKADVLPELAYAINDLIQDQADDSGSTISAMLTWVREDGSAYLTKGFRATCKAENLEMVRPLDATNVSIISQLQRHNEALAATVSTIATRQDERWERVLGLYERTIETLVHQRDAAVSDAQLARDERDQAIELADTAASEAERAAEAAEQAKQGDQLSKVIDIGVKQLLAGGSR